jgi:hypothetical protein
MRKLAMAIVCGLLLGGCMSGTGQPAYAGITVHIVAREGQSDLYCEPGVDRLGLRELTCSSLILTPEGW